MSTAQAQAQQTRRVSVSRAARIVGIATQNFPALAQRYGVGFTVDELTGWRVYDRAEVERLAEERAKRQRKSA